TSTLRLCEGLLPSGQHANRIRPTGCGHLPCIRSVSMHDKSDVLSMASMARSNPHLAGVVSRVPKEGETDQDAREEDSCPAFGYLRGIRDTALAVELRLCDGNSEWHAYNRLESWRFNPSAGLLLKFTGGDVVTLVLIRGSNLDVTVNDGPV